MRVAPKDVLLVHVPVRRRPAVAQRLPRRRAAALQAHQVRQGVATSRRPRPPRLPALGGPDRPNGRRKSAATAGGSRPPMSGARACSRPSSAPICRAASGEGGAGRQGRPRKPGEHHDCGRPDRLHRPVGAGQREDGGQARPRRRLRDLLRPLVAREPARLPQQMRVQHLDGVLAPRRSGTVNLMLQAARDGLGRAVQSSQAVDGGDLVPHRFVHGDIYPFRVFIFFSSCEATILP